MTKNKLIFIIPYIGKYPWYFPYFLKSVSYNPDNHTKDCLNDKGNIQIIYSFPLDRFLDEGCTLEALKEFIEYCNSNGISELKLV